MPAALFGITNDALNLAVNLLILFLVVLWVALIAWTFFDARRRIADPILVASATAASLFPFLGTIVYTILRPPEFLADKRERELEIRASELRVRQLEEASCPNCEHPVERTFLRCPELPRADQGPVRVVRQADRPAVVDLPLLRDAAAPRGAGRAPAVDASGARRPSSPSPSPRRRRAGRASSRPSSPEPLVEPLELRPGAAGAPTASPSARAATRSTRSVRTSSSSHHLAPTDQARRVAPGALL